MRVRVLGGIGEIGGNKVLVECGDRGVLLDFGASYQRESLYFDPPFLAPTDVGDMLKTGLLPRVGGLYGPNAWDGGAVLISHAHWDHIGYAPVLGPGTRVFVGEAAWSIVEAREELSARRDWRRRFDHLSVETFSTGREIEPAGDFQAIPIHVDHSIPGSYGFLVRCGGESLAYTGDLRFHGEKGYLTEDFVEAAREEGIGTLITEGTNLAPEGDPESAVIRLIEAMASAKMGSRVPKRVRLEARSEREVGERMGEVLEERPDSLVVVDSGPADVDRIRTVWRVAGSVGRRLVMSESHAVIVDRLGRSGLVGDLPRGGDYDLLLRKKKLRGGSGEAYLEGRSRAVRSLAEGFGGEVMWGEEGRGRLLRDGAGYIVLTANPARLLKDLLPPSGIDAGITFVMSRSEPFSEETALGLDRVLGWLSLYGVDVYYRIHVSGHAYPEDLARMVSEVDPQVVIPIHSLHPDLLRAYLPRQIRGRVRLPEEGAPLTVPRSAR